MEVKHKTIALPESWNEVTIEQFQEIFEVDDDESRTNNIIAILANEDVEIIRNLDKASRDAVTTALEWAFVLPDESRYNVEIDVDGEKMYLIDLNDITIGEWIDLIYYCKDYGKNMHKIFNMLYRSGTGKNEEKIRKHAKIGDVYGALVFFSHIASRSIESIQNYLFKEVETKTTS